PIVTSGVLQSQSPNALAAPQTRAPSRPPAQPQPTLVPGSHRVSGMQEQAANLPMASQTCAPVAPWGQSQEIALPGMHGATASQAHGPRAPWAVHMATPRLASPQEHAKLWP